MATPFYKHGDVFHARQEELEREEFMRGEARGRLAVALDVLTDALVLVGQHGVYCASNRNPALPKMDLRQCWRGLAGRRSWWLRCWRSWKPNGDSYFAASIFTKASVVSQRMWSSV